MNRSHLLGAVSREALRHYSDRWADIVAVLPREFQWCLAHCEDDGLPSLAIVASDRGYRILRINWPHVGLPSIDLEDGPDAESLLKDVSEATRLFGLKCEECNRYHCACLWLNSSPNPCVHEDAEMGISEESDPADCVDIRKIIEEMSEDDDGVDSD